MAVTEILLSSIVYRTLLKRLRQRNGKKFELRLRWQVGFNDMGSGTTKPEVVTLEVCRQESEGKVLDDRTLTQKYTMITSEKISSFRFPTAIKLWWWVIRSKFFVWIFWFVQL